MIPDDYQLDEQISSTDSAQVWKGRDPSGAPVVLKMASTVSRVERRFKREIESMQAAAGFHVMPILDSDESFSWYSMPVAVQSLYETSVPASLEEGLVVLEAVSEALHSVHSSGQVHRDLKPQNILWLDDSFGSRWVVADFGIIRNAPGLTTQQLTQIGGLTGSHGWAAPEQYRDAHSSSITADVFGAAAILSWMLTGVQPQYGYVAFPSTPRLKAVLRRATDPNPALRYSSLDDFLKAIKDAATTSTASLGSLIRSGDWPRVSFYVGQPEWIVQAVKSLPQLQKLQVAAWFKADPAGLISAVRDALDDLSDDIRDLPFSDIDSFLSWGVDVLRILVNSGDLDSAEQVAISLFGATAKIHQFEPAKVILEWLNGLNDEAQQAMETALHSSMSLEFFQQQAQNRWKTKGESDLVMRLRAE